MTTTINLLPWREERRKRQQQEFILLLVAAAIIGIVLFFGWKMMVDGQIADQRARNSHIQAKSAELDAKIKEINELKARRDELVARMEVIQNLQGNRPTIVYIFDQLVRTMPDGVYYASVKREGEKFVIHGVAESNNRISRLMRNFDDSPWFADANLIKVAAVEKAGSRSGGCYELKAVAGSSGSQTNCFELTVKQTSPNSNKEEEKK